MARTAKTAIVMNLLSPSDCAGRKNPLLPSNRSSGREKNEPVRKPFGSVPYISPALKLSEAEKSYCWNCRGTQMLNIVTMLINDELGAILERFNICSCDECCHVITDTVMSELPSVFIRVAKKSDEQKVNELLVQYRPLVIKSLTKTAILMRTRPIHTKKA